MPYYARPGQLLADHLRGVAKRCREFAADALPEHTLFQSTAELAGLWHDLGKYRAGFQERIKQIAAEEFARGGPETFHKQAGAGHADQLGHAIIAFAIAGHHGGMPDGSTLKHLIRDDSGLPVAKAVWTEACHDCTDLAGTKAQPLKPPNGEAADLLTRLLFSCLVDADWTDSARHTGEWSAEPAPPLQASVWLSKLLGAIQERAAGVRMPAVAAARKDVLEAALANAAQPTGLFSMTVPTGGGKTLSGLAFALRHAEVHHLRRVIYVAPYLSIIEQNARVMREALGFTPESAEVFEHHSLREPVDGEQNALQTESQLRRAENWDAPLVITTSVQFFESLFANQPGQCRKLHNIARSVIVLDECQTLPPGLITPTCAMLKQLCKLLGCSIVLCTATQPAFDHLDIKDHRLTDVREIAPPALDLFARLKRVEVTWPKDGEVLDWPAVAQRLSSEPSALCVVNTRKAARDLFKLLQERVGTNAFHLSTSMCPAHRLEVLDRVRALLKDKQPCYLVSTQLIEAGVDVDFPFLMRELGPLEAIVQAAGRCNREGLQNSADGKPGGRVVVFRSVEGSLPSDGWYRRGKAILESEFLKTNHEPRIDAPADLREYFTRLYCTGDLDKHGIQSLRAKGNFEEVAELYRLIKDDSVPVVVATWSDQAAEIDKLIRALEHHHSKAGLRKLGPFQVNLRKQELAKVSWAIIEKVPGVRVWNGGYDAAIGLTDQNVDTLLVI